MRGYNGGSLASNLVVNTLLSEYEQVVDQVDYKGLSKSSIEKAHQEIKTIA